MITLTTNAAIDDVRTGLEHMLDATAAQRTVLRDVSDTYVAALREKTPLGRGEQPGRLRAGYDTSEQEFSAESGRIRIVNTVPHLRYVLEGRPAVVVKNARALRFVIDGVVIFRHSVGPAAANPFDLAVEHAMQSVIDDANARMADIIIEQYRT